MADVSFPLAPIEVQIKNHAILMTTGFLILLPIGVLVPRLLRTFTNGWFLPHAVIQLILSGPVIFAGWYYGHDASEKLGFPQFTDPHQKMGLALLIMYVAQLLLGAFSHWVKLPERFPGGHRPANILHVILGLAILVVAASQVHYGLTIEWQFATGGLHVIPDSAIKAWTAIVTIFWVLYLLGLALLPRQYKQEKNAGVAKRNHAEKDIENGTRSGTGSGSGGSDSYHLIERTDHAV